MIINFIFGPDEIPYSSCVCVITQPCIYIEAIRMKIELDVHTGDETYLRHVRRKLPVALDDFKPDIVVYNAGIYVLLYLVITSLFILLLYLVIS